MHLTDSFKRSYKRVSKTNALLDTFNTHKTKRNKQLRLIKIYFEIISTTIKDMFKYLWFECFFTRYLRESFSRTLS